MRRRARGPRRRFLPFSDAELSALYFALGSGAFDDDMDRTYHRLRAELLLEAAHRRISIP